MTPPEGFDGAVAADLAQAYGLELPRLEHLVARARQRALKQTERSCYQAMEGFVHNLNTMHSRAGAQTPFSSINYGTDTTPEGRMVIRNILLCASVAFGLGLTAEQIARGIEKIRPIEHRLQLIRNPGGMSVIDDAFNSNIRGARQAFQVLKVFPEKRIVVTPGMVELGEKEYEMNREFGEAMADCCDRAILVGKKRSQAISEGLRAGGFAENNIHVVSSLDEATALLRQIVTPGDTVLFENDLPDNYTE